ncbi:MAG: hypothetical protein KJ548_06765 [Actinobacteria bacterium]|nr:hypothetical protein [Actinomycetota bacterium]
MIWWVVWTVLVAATLVGAFLLGRSLWRRSVALGHELARAGRAAEQLSDRVAELAEARRPVTVVHPLVADAADRAGWRSGLADRHRSRDARRSAARTAAHLRWDALWR